MPRIVKKGKLGEAQVRAMLLARGWKLIPIPQGFPGEDFIATDPQGGKWSIEVKNHKNLTLDHMKQCMANARKHKKRWMLFQHLHDSSWWLVRCQGGNPELWKEIPEVNNHGQDYPPKIPTSLKAKLHAVQAKFGLQSELGLHPVQED